MADYNPQLSTNSEEISKKITEAFYAFAEFSEDYPQGRISFKELKKVL